MSNVKLFLWLADQSVAVGFILLFHVGVVCLCVFCGSLVMQFHKQPDKAVVLRRLHWILLPGIIPIANLVFGVFCKFDGTYASAPVWPGYVVIALFMSHMPVACVQIWKTNGMRWLTAGVHAMIFWYSLSAAMVSGMAVLNAWPD